MPIETPRNEVNRMSTIWQRCRDVIEGCDAVKARREDYLPKLAGQDDEDYRAYVARANFYNGTGRTVGVMVGCVFRADPEIENPESLQAIVDDHLSDITLDGTPFAGLAIRTVKEVLSIGRMGLLVDMHAQAEGSVTPPRPYWVTYQGEQIINWQTTKIGGDYRLSLVVLKEHVEEFTDAADPYTPVEHDQYRVLDLVSTAIDAATPEGVAYRVRLFKVQEEGEGDQKKRTLIQIGGDILPKRIGQPLTFIPFLFINPTTVQPAIELPPLLDMVDVNLSHYRSSADLEHGRHYTALPTPWVVGAPDNGSLKIGAGVAWLLKGQGASAGYLEFTGQGLKALEQALQEKADQMDALGIKLTQSTIKVTAEAVRAASASSQATLKTITTSVSQALSRALFWHLWWNGADLSEDDVSIALNQEFFDQTLAATDVAALTTAHQGQSMSFKTVFYNLERGGWMRPGVDADEELLEIQQENDAKDQAAMAALKAVNAVTNPDAVAGAGDGTGENLPLGQSGQGIGDVPPSGAL